MHPELDLCYRLLPKVSRTFALNIRILPRPLRPQVTVAYLLFRFADTIEDAPGLSLEERADLFEAFLDRLDGTRQLSFPEGPFVRLMDVASPAELELLEAGVRIFDVLESFPQDVQNIISAHVSETARGMLKVIREKMRDGLLQIDSWQELDEYCYYVAGTIGIMLTRLFALHSKYIDPDTLKRLTTLGTSFGRGLQLTNMLKGIGTDRVEGRCYLPATALAAHGVHPSWILDPRFQTGVRTVVEEICARAVQDLEDALRYTILLPRREARLRLFCLWPLFTAVRTLGLVATGSGVPDPRAQLKISRAELYREMALSGLQVFSNGILRKRFARFRRELFPARVRHEVWAG
ncbi:MAG TPA: phytoene/squalene synthase family protein [bacterium]|nr:phytoene/squalene synthase family protein [bacterium]